MTDTLRKKPWLCLTAALLTVLAFQACTGRPAEGKHQGTHVLFLMPRNLGANNFLVRDVMEEFGWKVTRTAVLEEIPPCGFWGQHPGALPVRPDVMVSDISDLGDYDCLFIATSPGQAWKVPDSYSDLLDSPEALDLVRSAVSQGLAVFAMCSGVRVLAAADVLQDTHVVGAPRFRDEFTAAGALYEGNERNDTRPLIDGNIITAARGQTYNDSIVMAVASVLEEKLPRGAKSLSDGAFLKDGGALFTDEDVAWARTYGGSGADGIRSMCAAPEGGFLLTGYTHAPGARDADLLVVKTDAEGRPVWKRILGGSGSEYGNGCLALEDGYLVAGYTSSFGAGARDVVLIKLDAEGREAWRESMDLAMRREGRRVRYVVARRTRSFLWDCCCQASRLIDSHLALIGY